MWEHRNGILHDKEEGILYEEEKKLVRAEYKLGFDYFPNNLQTHVELSLEEALELPPRQRHKWLDHIQQGRIAANTRAQDPQVQAQHRTKRDLIVTGFLILICIVLFITHWQIIKRYNKFEDSTSA